MYKCVSVRAAEIRKKLKAISYNSRMVSVRSSQFSGGDDINIRMKSVDVDETKVREICKSYESIDYDEYSGEILMNANSFVFVEWDSGFIENGAEKYKALAENIRDKDEVTTDSFRWLRDFKSMAVWDQYGVKHQFQADIYGISEALFFAIEIYKVIKEDELK